MINRITLTILAMLLGVASMSAQPAFHSAFSVAVIEEGSKQFDLGIFNAPIYGISSHIAADRMIGESALDYQLDIAGVRELIMYVNTPDDKKMTFLVDTFWGLFPDIWDKCIDPAHHIFHQYSIQPLVPFDRGTTDLLEELSVLSYTVKF